MNLLRSLTTLSLCGAALLAACSPTQAPAPLPRERSSPVDQLGGSLVVTRASQSSHGASPEDIDNAFIASMEGHFAEESRLHYIAAMRRLGHQPRDIVFEAATIVLKHNDGRLAVTEVTPSRGRAKSKIVWWIEGDQLKRVVCADTGGEEIQIRHGPCAAEIAATFQIGDWQLDGPQ